MDYHIEHVSTPKPNDINVLGDGITAYAKLRKNQPPIELFAFFVKDAANKITGGCNGALYYGLRLH